MSKWMTATLNSTAAPVLIRHAVVELLAVNQQFAPVPFGVYGYEYVDALWLAVATAAVVPC